MWHTWGAEEVQIGIWWRNLKERDHLEDIGVDVRIILKWIFKNQAGGVEWIDLAQDRDKWRALVKMVMDRPVP